METTAELLANQIVYWNSVPNFISIKFTPDIKDILNFPKNTNFITYYKDTKLHFLQKEITVDEWQQQKKILKKLKVTIIEK